MAYLSKKNTKQHYNKKKFQSIIPQELLSEIALYLEVPSSDLFNFMLINHKFNKAVNHGYVWRMICKRTFSTLFFNSFKKDLLKKKGAYKNFFKNYHNYHFTYKNISCGAFCTFFVAEDQEGKMRVFAYGYNRHGQLGFGHTKNIKTPQPITKGIPKGAKILDIICGYFHTVFSVKDKEGKRRVFTCGYNSYGQLGLGHTKNAKEPQQIKGEKCSKTSTESPNHGSVPVISL